MSTKDDKTPFLSNLGSKAEQDVVIPDGMIDSSVGSNPFGNGWRRWGLKDQSTDAASPLPDTPDIFAAPVAFRVNRGKK